MEPTTDVVLSNDEDRWPIDEEVIIVDPVICFVGEWIMIECGEVSEVVRDIRVL